MKVKWLGHSAFLLTAADGTRVITDPYVAGSYGNTLCYAPIEESCDAATESHDHDDHAGAGSLPGKPEVIRGADKHKVKSIAATGFDTAHDDAGGSKRGRNTVFLFVIDGLKVCHLGDLGEPLPAAVATAIGPVDVLLAPVGGFFTIDATEARKVADELHARITIPMHYKTDKCGFTIDSVEPFIKGRSDVKQAGTSEVEVTKDTLPDKPETWVLKHAL